MTNSQSSKDYIHIDEVIETPDDIIVKVRTGGSMSGKPWQKEIKVSKKEMGIDAQAPARKEIVPGMGSAFTEAGSAVKKPAEPFKSIAPSIEGTNLTKVLVIEDEPDFAKEASKLPNCEMMVARTLKEALELMKTFGPNFVISDVNFPAKENEDPKDQSKHILDACLYYNVSVVFVTRMHHHGYIRDASENDVVGIFTLTPSEIVSVLTLGNDVKLERGLASSDNFQVIPEVLSMLSKDAPQISVKSFRTDCKTTMIYSEALAMLKNLAATNDIRDDLKKSLNEAKSLGMTARIEDGKLKISSKPPPLLVIR